MVVDYVKVNVFKFAVKENKQKGFLYRLISKYNILIKKKCIYY